MPCQTSDGMGSSHDYSGEHELRRKLATTDAILCGVLRALEKAGVLPAIIESIDEAAAGVPKAEIERWFAAHKKRDENQSGA